MLKPRQRLGKFLIERKLGEGGFAVVYRALDTIEGVRVALKIPYPHLMGSRIMESFRREVRIAARLEHPNIVPLKYADYIDGHFVIVTALGEMTLHDRMQRRMSSELAIGFCEQMLEAVAYAHRNRVMHCDIKPDNFLLFPGNSLRLTDFGIARVAQRTLRASGAGTIGFVAPEQAMGRPSFRSDVFSLGLVIYRMLSGELPEWPFQWPPPGYDRLRERHHQALIELMRRAIQVDATKRFRDAAQMLAAFLRAKSTVARFIHTRRRRRPATRRDWQSVRRQEFLRQFGKALRPFFACLHCEGPVSEAMFFCPWCGQPRLMHRHETSFPAYCRRCRRGMKLDWSYCPWCYGPGFQPLSTRTYSDTRYVAACWNPQCRRKQLMPFMRYCPWCHRRVRRKWRIEGSPHRCANCKWGIVPAYWSYCPWCGKRCAD